MNSVIEFGPHTKMTPQEALALCQREDWDSIIIAGYEGPEKDFIVRSSALSREEALWLAEHLRLHALNLL